MNKKLLPLAALWAVACAGLSAQPAEPQPPASKRLMREIAPEFWNDDAFVKEFLGSYGFLAGYEPQISEEEKDALRTLIDLIKVSPAAAIQQLEPQIKTSSSAAFDFILANLYFQEGDLDAASEHYTKAITKYPNFRRAYKNLGLVQVQQGNFDAAINTISKAMELGEVDGRAYGLLGYGYLTQERYYPAEAAYRQAILMQPEIKDWKIGLARTLLESARYGEAIALFDTLIKDNPDKADYWLLQSNAYIGLGESMKAARNIEIVRRMGAAEAGTLTLLGDIYMNNESPDLALGAYLAAAERAGPEDAQALLRAAEVLTQTANYDQAQTMITRVREKLEGAIDKERDLRLLTLEAKIARAQGNGEKAVATLRRIVEQDALNGEALIELADHYAEQGDMARAVTRYQQAEKIEEFERRALIAHGQALVRAGDYSEALPLLKRALQIRSEANLEDYARRVERAAESRS